MFLISQIISNPTNTLCVYVLACTLNCIVSHEPKCGWIITYLGETRKKYVAGFRVYNIFNCERSKKEQKDELSSIFRFYAEIQNISVQLFCLKMQSKNIAFFISYAVINIRPYNGETEIPIFLSLFFNLRAAKYLEQDKCGDSKQVK